MAKYVPFQRFTGDWNNQGRGRVAGCPTCGYSFTAFIPLKAAWCPRGHAMKLLTNNNPKVACNLRARDSACRGENRLSDRLERVFRGQVVRESNRTPSNASQPVNVSNLQGTKR